LLRITLEDRFIIEGRMDTPGSDLSYVVRYGVTRIVGEFSARGMGSLARGASVIIRTDRGMEWGTVLSTATDQSRRYLGTSDEHGRVIRLATPDDEVQRDKNLVAEKEAFVGGQELVLERKMQMQLIDIERVFGGERLIFYYLAEDRVDFRELVKALAKRFQTRIEMRQIGIRDEAKLLADYGDCGQPVCCNTFLREMPPVSMKMAKLQKATLDPTKISGRCGRLKCCLRYEYDTYEESRRELPPVGATVVTKQGTGRIIGQELLARKLMVAYEGQRQVMTDEKDILTVVSTKSGKPAHTAGTAEREPASEQTDSPRREDRPRGGPRPDDRSRGDDNRPGGRGQRPGPPRSGGSDGSGGSGDQRDKPNPNQPT
jgi:cell fate regulator YaaT (PSP1 superfamily)